MSGIENKDTEIKTTDTETTNSVNDVDDGKATLSGASSESSLLLKKEDEDKARKRLLTGIGLSVLFAGSMTLSVPCLQLLVPANIKPMELLFLAFSAHLLTSVPLWFIFWNRLRTLERNQVPWLVLTGLCNAMSTTCFYMAAESLPSGVLGAVGEGTLLIFSVLIYAILDRHVGKLIILATVLCIVGLGLYLASMVHVDPVTIEVPPSANYSSEPILAGRLALLNPRVHMGLREIHPSLPYFILTMSSVLMIVANAILHRKFGDLSIIKLLLFFPIIGFIVALVALFSLTTPDWNLRFYHSASVFPFIGFLLLFIVSNISLYASWMRTPAPIFSLIVAGSIVLLIVIQYMIPVPGIKPGTLDPLEICGAILILLANIIGPLAELQMDPCRRCNKEA